MLFDSNKQVCTDPKQIANLLQDQFTSVFSDPLATDSTAADFDVCASLSSPFLEDQINFTEEDIILAINDINANAASGPDEIPVSLLKNCKERLARPIFILWSHSFSGGIPSTFLL
jgi:hypothetical protein